MVDTNLYKYTTKRTYVHKLYYLCTNFYLIN